MGEGGLRSLPPTRDERPGAAAVAAAASGPQAAGGSADVPGALAGGPRAAGGGRREGGGGSRRRRGSPGAAWGGAGCGGQPCGGGVGWVGEGRLRGGSGSRCCSPATARVSPSLRRGRGPCAGPSRTALALLARGLACTYCLVGSLMADGRQRRWLLTAVRPGVRAGAQAGVSARGDAGSPSPAWVRGARQRLRAGGRSRGSEFPLASSCAALPLPLPPRAGLLPSASSPRVCLSRGFWSQIKILCRFALLYVGGDC